jgi:hypothetical protein
VDTTPPPVVLSEPGAAEPVPQQAAQSQVGEDGDAAPCAKRKPDGHDDAVFRKSVGDQMDILYNSDHHPVAPRWYLAIVLKIINKHTKDCKWLLEFRGHNEKTWHDPFKLTEKIMMKNPESSDSGDYSHDWGCRRGSSSSSEEDSDADATGGSDRTLSYSEEDESSVDESKDELYPSLSGVSSLNQFDSSLYSEGALRRNHELRVPCTYVDTGCEGGRTLSPGPPVTDAPKLLRPRKRKKSSASNRSRKRSASSSSTGAGTHFTIKDQNTCKLLEECQAICMHEELQRSLCERFHAMLVKKTKGRLPQVFYKGYVKAAGAAIGALFMSAHMRRKASSTPYLPNLERKGGAHLAAKAKPRLEFTPCTLEELISLTDVLPRFPLCVRMKDSNAHVLPRFLCKVEPLPKVEHTPARAHKHAHKHAHTHTHACAHTLQRLITVAWLKETPPFARLVAFKMNAVGGLSSMLLAPELPDVQPTDVLAPTQTVGSRTLGLRRLLDEKRFVCLKLMDNHFAPYGFPHGACTHILQHAGHIDTAVRG